MDVPKFPVLSDQSGDNHSCCRHLVAMAGEHSPASTIERFDVTKVVMQRFEQGACTLVRIADMTLLCLLAIPMQVADVGMMSRPVPLCPVTRLVEYKKVQCGSAQVGYLPRVVRLSMRYVNSSVQSQNNAMTTVSIVLTHRDLVLLCFNSTSAYYCCLILRYPMLDTYCLTWRLNELLIFMSEPCTSAPGWIKSAEFWATGQEFHGIKVNRPRPSLAAEICL
jgi:hypothetical protein